MTIEKALRSCADSHGIISSEASRLNISSLGELLNISESKIIVVEDGFESSINWDETEEKGKLILDSGQSLDIKKTCRLHVKPVNSTGKLIWSGSTMRFGKLGTSRDINRAAISYSSNGNNTLVAAVTGKKIRVVQIFMIAATAVSVTLQSGAGGTGLTGAVPVGDTGGFVLPFNDAGWFETAAGSLLNAFLSSGVQVSGCLGYRLIG